MSEEATGERAKPGVSLFKRLMFGSLILFLIFLVGLLVSYGLARSALTDNLARVEAALKELEVREKSRPVVFGVRREGNAVWDYNALEWLLAPRNEWSSAPRNLPKLSHGRGHFAKSDAPVKLAKLVDMVRAEAGNIAEWQRLDKYSKAGPAWTPEERQEALTFYERHGATLLAPIDAAMSRKFCDWEIDYAKAVDSPIPGPLVLRTGANLLAYRSVTGSDAVAVDSCLKAIAMGHDVSRIPGLVGDMLGVAISSIGYYALELALRRPLSESLCQRVLEVLGKLGAWDFERLLKEERICQDFLFARLSGKGEPIGKGAGFAGQLPTNSLLVARDWSYCQTFWEPAIKHARSPYSEYVKAQRDPQDADRGLHPLTSILMPDLLETRKHVLESDAYHDCCLIGAAARLYRMKSGTWPKSADDLKTILGGVPKDRYTDLAKPYEIKAEGLNFVVKTRDKGQDFDRTIAIRVRAAK